MHLINKQLTKNLKILNIKHNNSKKKKKECFCGEWNSSNGDMVPQELYVKQ